MLPQLIFEQLKVHIDENFFQLLLAEQQFVKQASIWEKNLSQKETKKNNHKPSGVLRDERDRDNDYARETAPLCISIPNFSQFLSFMEKNKQSLIKSETSIFSSPTNQVMCLKIASTASYQPSHIEFSRLPIFGGLTINFSFTGKNKPLIAITGLSPTFIPNEENKVRAILEIAWLESRFGDIKIPKKIFDELSIENIEKEKKTITLQPYLKRQFFRSIILSRKPSSGLRMLDHFNILQLFLPELNAGKGLSQNRFHAYDIYDHSLRALDGALDIDEVVRWSALLHDIGKVPTRKVKPNGEASFYNHEVYSARMVTPIMKRLNIPKEIGQKVRFLVRNHMFHYTDQWTDKAIRRFQKKLSNEDLEQLILLRLADRHGSGKKTAFPKGIEKLINHIDAVQKEQEKMKVKDLAVGGTDLMQKFDLTPGPVFGEILEELLQKVSDNVLLNERNILLLEIEKIISEKFSAANDNLSKTPIQNSVLGKLKNAH